MFFCNKKVLLSVALLEPKLSILQRRQLLCDQIKVFGLGVANKVLLQHPSDNHDEDDDDGDDLGGDHKNDHEVDHGDEVKSLFP